MDEFEFIIFAVSIIFAFLFLKEWFGAPYSAWPAERYKLVHQVFGFLPFVSVLIILYVLKNLASFDVVDDTFYIIFYILLGITFISFGLKMVTYYFDISWQDDAVNLNNKAALCVILGAFLGLTFIYSGANIGDGPGWWCVLFAGALGLITFLILGFVIAGLLKVSEKITIDRDISTGIRFGFYLCASGIILGKACSGDWTSFYMTVIEFFRGWPVLYLTIAVAVSENFYKNKKSSNYSYSLILGFLYIAFSVASLVFLMRF